MTDRRFYMVLWRFTKPEMESYENPDSGEIITAIHSLNGTDVSMITLDIDYNILHLRRAAYDRVEVRCTDGLRINGILADTQVNSEEMIDIYYSSRGIRMDDLEYIEYTVPEEEALYVVKHYFKTGYLPAAREGTKWIGNLDGMIKS